MSNCGGGGAGGGGGGAASGAAAAARRSRCRGLLTSALVARRGLRLWRARQRPEPPRQVPAGLPQARAVVARTCRRARRCGRPRSAVVAAAAGAACAPRSDRAAGVRTEPGRAVRGAAAPARRAGWWRAPRAVRLRRSRRKPQQIVGERRRAFAAVGVVLAQEAREAALALVLGKPLRPLVAAAAGAVGRKQRGRGLGAEILAPRPRTAAGCCRSGRWLPERPTGTAWQPPPPHHTQTPPWSDAPSPATRPPCPRHCARATDPNPLFNP